MTASQAANQLISIIKRRRAEEGAELGKWNTHTHTLVLVLVLVLFLVLIHTPMVAAAMQGAASTHWEQ